MEILSDFNDFNGSFGRAVPIFKAVVP